jgi:uncharacterized protein
MTSDNLQLRVISSLGSVSAADWNACTLPPGSHTIVHRATDSESKFLNFIDNPFVTHEFLLSLELSMSVGRRAGWEPRYILVENTQGELQGAAPCFMKSHSRGEYVFDRAWAEAYERAGGTYYPKLQVSVPFTPAAGPRLLVRQGAQPLAVRTTLAAGLPALCGELETSSVHVTFLPEAEARFLADRGFLLRTDQQFRWQNAGYSSFEDFLAALAARKRKAIRRERKEALAGGVTVHWLMGSDLTEQVWDAFFDCYLETGSRKWGRPYLTREFYSLVGEKMRDRILLIMARRAGRWIGGAINFIGGGTLYGRHWGAVEPHPFLHFEVCYYQAIEFAIQHGLTRVEAGAQGEHKLARGYLPVTTYSAHFIVDPALRRAVADYLCRERTYVAEAGAELAGLAPYRKDIKLGPAVIE